MYDNPYDIRPEHYPPEKKRNAGLIIAVAVLAVLLVSLTAVLVFVMNRQSSDPVADSGDVTTTQTVTEQAPPGGTTAVDIPTVADTTTPAAAAVSPEPGLRCDGRGILIVESVMVSPGRDATAAVDAAVSKWNRTFAGNVESTTPGACPSLRARVDGQDVYPVYVDYGFNTSDLCTDWRSYGGNARVLSNNAEFVSPC